MVTIFCHMECFILLPSMSIVEEMKRAPQNLFSILYGVLHMASNSNHMEYSTWHIFGVSWSASGSTPSDYIYCHMEYSIRSIFDAIWSTPCGHYFLPYGVLHIIAIHVNCGRKTCFQCSMEYSIWP